MLNITFDQYHFDIKVCYTVCYIMTKPQDRGAAKCDLNGIVSQPSGNKQASETNEQVYQGEVYKILKNYLSSESDFIPADYRAEDRKCLLKFHNCTAYTIVLNWIDHRGRPKRYPDLPRGAAIEIDSYMSHLWHFKPNISNANGRITIRAVEETELGGQDDDIDSNRVSLEDLETVKRLPICSLCKLRLRKHFVQPNKLPCGHLTGEIKFSLSHLHQVPTILHTYCCRKGTHMKSHATNRRNIYLVDTFKSLKELGLLAISSNITEDSSILSLRLPKSLAMDYIIFTRASGC